MINKREIIDILFTDNLFWDLETHQEAKQLFKQAFESYPELRETLLSKVSLRSLQEIGIGAEEKETDEFYEYIIFDTLSEIKDAKYKIPNDSELKFQDILKSENFKVSSRNLIDLVYVGKSTARGTLSFPPCANVKRIGSIHEGFSP